MFGFTTTTERDQPDQILRRAIQKSRSPYGSVHGLTDESNLHIEKEMADVSILHHMVSALHLNLALILGHLLRSGGDQVVVLDHFDSDETSLDIAVDLSSGLVCR